MSHSYWDTGLFGGQMGYYNGQTWITIVSIVIALVIALVLVIDFCSKKNVGRWIGFKAKLYDILNFKVYLIEAFYKYIYIVFSLYFILRNFIALFFGHSPGFFGRLLIFTLGTVVELIAIRLIFEGLLLFIVACSNISNINKMLTAKYSGVSMDTKEKNICKNCGKHIPPENSFCSNCGASR